MLKASRLWRFVNKLNLNTNMRALRHGDENAEVFARKLLSIGDGKAPTVSGLRIALTGEFYNFVPTTELLVEKVFPDLTNNISNSDWVGQRAILAPTNAIVDTLNLRFQSLLDAQPSMTYRSRNETVVLEEAVNFPIEFLDGLKPNGFPPYLLILRIGSPIMLLRNLKPPKLCNGTRMQVISSLPNLIHAKIIVGPHAGERVSIPRIPLISGEDDVIHFKRTQFPVTLAFAMTDKSQGQTLEVAGVELEEQCFSHGQLYVACSRVGAASNLFIHAEVPQAMNIVYARAIQ